MPVDQTAADKIAVSLARCSTEFLTSVWLSSSCGPATSPYPVW